MVKAVVVLLSWDVRLPLCIVDSQICSSTALVGYYATFVCRR